MKERLHNICITLICVLLTISLQMAFKKLNMRDENIYLFFVLAIFVVINETKHIIYGIISAFAFVMSFNYFITEPRYSFVVDDPNYLISFIIFIIVTFIISSLVTRLQKQINIAKSNERKIRALYKFSTDFLNCKTAGAIYKIVVENLRVSTLKNISIVTYGNVVYGDDIDPDLYRDAIIHSLNHNTVTGKNQKYFSQYPITIFPVVSKKNKYCTLISEDEFSKDQKDFINSIIEEMIVVLDKEYITNEEEKAKIKIEKEQFRNSLLRGLSHDIKTPLTSIQSGSNFLYESFEQIEDLEKKSIINDIYNESCGLTEFVENLLNMTKIDEKNNLINCQYELVDDILQVVSEKVRRRLGKHKLVINQQEELMMVYCDANLLIQVFVNLIDNAVKHTKDDSVIEVNYYSENNRLFFEVSDNGGGINEKILPKIFEDFYSIATKQDRKRSTGLGLGICKAIITAHKGRIKAYNNDKGGATFSFYVPAKGK